MKIVLAQIRPQAGAVTANLQRHLQFIRRAAEADADIVFFPELSLTSYEPELAQELTFNGHEEELQQLQQASNQHYISVGVGLPWRQQEAVQIGMLIIQPQLEFQLYVKQLLHQDEEPFFVPGQQQVLINLAEQVIAPAICYESLQASHLAEASTMGATIYLASVAKDQGSIGKSDAYFPEAARKHQIPILMVNSIGPCDNFVAAGQSSVWNAAGQLITRADQQEALLIWDSQTGSTRIIRP